MTTIRMISWNVNGLRAVQRKDALGILFNDRPDIFCVQETKINDPTLPDDLRNVDGYHTHFTFAERKGYSGVATYSKIEPQSVSHGLGIEHFDNEGRTLISDYGSFVLFNIYFPNGKASAERLQYKMDFYDAFLDKAEAVNKQGKNIVICGDVNTAHKEIDLARPKENAKRSGFLPEEREWIDKLLDHGYLDTFRVFNQEPGHYSWWDMVTRARERDVGWRIDYFYINEGLKDNLKDAFILKEVMGSDHCPIGIDLEIPD